jgi:hypothetical protein
MDTIGRIFRSEPQANSRASDEATPASASELARARAVDRLTDQAGAIRFELAVLKTGEYNPRAHPARRAKLVSMLREIERKLLEHKQRRLL